MYLATHLVNNVLLMLKTAVKSMFTGFQSLCCVDGYIMELQYYPSVHLMMHTHTTIV